MGQRRQVARGSHRALAGHQRQAVCVERREHPLHRLDADAGVALGEDVDAKSETGAWIKNKKNEKWGERSTRGEEDRRSIAAVAGAAGRRHHNTVRPALPVPLALELTAFWSWPG